MTLPELRTVAEFLEWEDAQDRKYEFADGIVSLFPGGTNRHGTIRLNIAIALRNRGIAAGSVFDETRTVTPHSSRYPDVAVTLDRRDQPDNTFLGYPILLLEVLSPSTETLDRGPKFHEYRTIDTLAEYVLVDSRQRWAQVFRRTGVDWIPTVPIETGDLYLHSLGVRIPFDETYAGTGL
jgi:Uma2 family endonuclease